MNLQHLHLFAALCCLALCKGQVTNGPRWWERLTTTPPDPRDPELLPFYDDTEDESHICCECVPFYLCDDKNTIIADGGNIVGPRFGAGARVQNVETCPDVTQLCCRPPSAPIDCVLTGTPPPSNRSTPDPNTQCECIHWEFCAEELRISDGSTPTTLIDDTTPLPRHTKCPRSLDVCCAFDFEPLATPPTPPPLPGQAGDCVCLNPWLCGEDGFIITDGAGVMDLRALAPVSPPCVPPQVCCREPVDSSATTPTKGRPPTRVVTTTPMPTIEDQRCNGVRNRNGISVRIAGFQEGESQFGEFPWAGMVLRTYFVADTPMNAFIGGAILINPRVMLTAAHKVANEVVANLSVRVGEWDIETDFEPGAHQVRKVESVVLHPSFNNRTLYHDVALLILKEPVSLFPHIRSICLATSVEDVDQSACVANGWGEDSFDTGNYQTVMKSVTLPLVPSQRCQALLRRTRLGRWFQLHPSFICAGGEAGADTCTSDGGGPLACPRLGSTTGEYLLVGITAWGIGCGEEGVPGVYASTMADNRWIMAEVEGRFPGHSAVRRDVAEGAEAANLLQGDHQLLNKTTHEVPAAPLLAAYRATTPETTLPTRASTTVASPTTAAPLTTPRGGWRQRFQRRQRWRQEQARRQKVERERRRLERLQSRNTGRDRRS